MLLAFDHKFSFVPLNPLNISWLQDGRDWSRHFLGWDVFYHNAESFFIGTIPNLNYPMGISVGFIDSLSLVAILFKFFKFLLPDVF